MDPIVLRAIERIIGTLIGALLVYLGYRLFLSLPEKTDSEGRVILPGQISVYLSRVGPGAFFALFGAGVVIASFYFGLTAESKESEDGVVVKREYLSYVGAGAHLEESRANVLGDIVLLNNLAADLKPNLDQRRQGDIKRAIPRIKLALMWTVWGEGKEWGDFGEFKKWVEGGALDPPPKGSEEAANFFRSGK